MKMKKYNWNNPKCKLFYTGKIHIWIIAHYICGSVKYLTINLVNLLNVVL